MQAGELPIGVPVVEPLQHAQPVGLGVRDQVEDLLQLSSEVEVHEPSEVLLHQTGHTERQERRDQRGALRVERQHPEDQHRMGESPGRQHQEERLEAAGLHEEI